jgi:hypothetical protein
VTFFHVTFLAVFFFSVTVTLFPKFNQAYIISDYMRYIIGLVSSNAGLNIKGNYFIYHISL